MQPFGAIYFAISGWAAGAALAYGAKLARLVPELLFENGARLEEAVAEGVFALVLWLPIAWTALRSQAKMLALAGGLPPTLRPDRAATLMSLAALAMFAWLEWATDGIWGSGPFRAWHGGFAPIVFHLSLPMLALGAVRLALGGPPRVEPEPATKVAEATGPRLAPAAPSTRMNAGPERDRVADALTGMDAIARMLPEPGAVELAQPGDTLRIRLDALVPACNAPSLSLSLRSNLLLYNAALADATRLAELGADSAAHEAATRIADKYRGGDIAASTDLGLVLAVAREARAAAAAEAGL